MSMGSYYTNNTQVFKMHNYEAGATWLQSKEISNSDAI